MACKFFLLACADAVIRLTYEELLTNKDIASLEPVVFTLPDAVAAKIDAALDSYESAVGNKALDSGMVHALKNRSGIAPPSYSLHQVSRVPLYGSKITAGGLVSWEADSCDEATADLERLTREAARAVSDAASALLDVWDRGVNVSGRCTAECT